MHAETSREGAAREARRLRSITASPSTITTSTAPTPAAPILPGRSTTTTTSSAFSSAAISTTTAGAVNAMFTTHNESSTPASSSSSAAASSSPRTPRRGKARSITYGDRFIPSRDGSDMQAAYQLMGDDLSAPSSRSKRKLTADMDAQKEEANQAFSSLLTTELFGLPTPPKVSHHLHHHSRVHSASASPAQQASSSTASHPQHHQHHQSTQHPRRPASAAGTSTSASGMAGSGAVASSAGGPTSAAATAAAAVAAASASYIPGLGPDGSGMYAYGPGAVTPHGPLPTAANGGASASAAGIPTPATAAAAAAAAAQRAIGIVGVSRPPSAGGGAGPSSAASPAAHASGDSGSPHAAGNDHGSGSGPSGGNASGLGIAMGMGLGGSSSGAAAAPAGGASSSSGSIAGPSTAMIGNGMHVTQFSGAPTPTTPTKRNLLSYRSPSVGRSAGRAPAASSSTSAAASGSNSSNHTGQTGTSAGMVASASIDLGTGGMRGTGGFGGTPSTPQSGQRTRRDSEDVDMVLLSGGTSSTAGMGGGSNENAGILPRPSPSSGLFGGATSLRGNAAHHQSPSGSGSRGTGSSHSGAGGGGGGGFGIDEIDSPSHKAYSLSPVKLESQRMLLGPRRTPRTMSKVPYKVLDAPDLADDFYLNLVDWSPSNVLGVGLGRCVYLWSAKTAQVSKLVDLEASADKVTGLSWAGRGPHIAIGTDAGLVQIYDAERMKLIRTHRGHTGRVGALAWNEHILSSGSRDRTILHHDVRVREQSIAKLAGHRQEVCGLKWNTESNQLASGGNDNKLMIWDGLHTEPLHRFARHEAAIKALAWSPHQHGLLASGGGTADMKIRFWNSLTGQMVQEVDTGSQVCNLMWSKTANEIVSTHGYSGGKVQNQIQVWRYPTMAPVATLTGHTMRVLYLAMSPDGETIVTGAGDETLRFWDLNTPSKSQLEKRNESAAFNAFAKIR